MIICDIHNPTRTPRIIHDGIEGSQRPIKIMPGETKYNVALSEFMVERLQSVDDDLVIILPEIITPSAIVNSTNTNETMVDRPIETPINYPLFIEIPAWGTNYVRLAVQYTIPAVLASLKESRYKDVTFFIHTDNRAAFETALQGHKIKFFAMKIATRPNAANQDPLPKHSWAQFMEAHREAIVATPIGGLLALLNSDIVVSRETFGSLDLIFSNPSVKVGISVGVRTLIDNADPPVGADFDTLARWAWDHRHEITRQSLWGSGRIHHSSHLYFEQDGNVVMHCFHLTPMFIRKDRNLSFKGTIDDDVLQKYQDGEVYFMRNREAFFAELSPAWKKHSCGNTAMTIETVVNFGKRKFSKAHVRNFAQCYPVVGPVFDHPAASQIFARLK